MSNTMTTTHDDFIMRPTVDVCFSGLMENPIVRKGFCAAIMRVPPDMIQDTELLPTHLRRTNAHDKLGILDVRVRLMDGVQLNLEMQVRYFEFWDERALFYLCKMFAEQLRSGEDYENLKKCIHVSILDFVHFPNDKECYRTIRFIDQKMNTLYSDKLELQVLELKKLPKEVRTGDDLINWMHFFNGKSKEDFKNMAKTSEYLGEAYETLQKLSADDIKRLEYEEREKELRDHNWIVKLEKRAEERLEKQVEELAPKLAEERAQKIALELAEERAQKIALELAEERAQKIALELAEERAKKIAQECGIQLTKRVFRLHEQKKTMQEIADKCKITVEKVREILE